MSIAWLDPDPAGGFPPVTRALDEPNGLLAAGGDLSMGRLLAAYRTGIFPWYEDEQPILWWSPDPRAVIFPPEFHISRSLRRRLRKPGLALSFDSQFDDVMRECASDRPGQSGTWITDEMQAAYSQLHHEGYAHSVEAWQDNRLVGGLYGVAIGRVFFAESMFSGVTDASKVVLAHLVAQLDRWGFGVIDCQIMNPHLLSLGCREIPRNLFVDLVASHCDLPGPLIWTFEPDLDKTGAQNFLSANA